MTEIQLIRRLPELEDNQEWACEHGCDHIKPKLYRHVYSESWDHEGIKLHKLAEHYYTCQKDHALEVYDTDKNDYVTLPDEAYQERENTYNFSLEQIQVLRKMLDDAKAEYCDNELFRYASVSIDITLKGGDVLKITYEYLDELEALFNQDLTF